MIEWRRGEVWLVALGAGRTGEPGKNRPALIMSVPEGAIADPSDLVVVIPLSSSRSPSPLRPVVGPDEGVERDSVAVCKGIRGISPARLLRRLGEASPGTIAEVEFALRLLLGPEG